MATYYVRTDGSDTNTGLGSSTAQAWATVQKALNSGGVTSGDTVYIAPGTYRETAWSGQTFTSTTTFIGDALATQFSGVTPGPVIVSTRPSDGGLSVLEFIGIVRSFTTLQGFYFDSSRGFLNPVGNNIIISDCVFQIQNSSAASSQCLYMTLTGTGDITVRRCVGTGVSEINCLSNTGTGSIRVESCNFYSTRFFASNSAATIVIVNSIIYSCTWASQNASGTYIVFNCILGQLSFANTSGTRVENYNYYTGGFATSRGNVTNGANSFVNYGRVTNWGYFAQNGLILTGELAPIQNGPLKGAGTSSLSGISAPVTDLYNKSFSSPPDIGAVSSAAFTGASYYIPTDRNASTITIAPGSTSQSIELYLGATGLTASTSGLSARYNRTRTASVSIPLVARTIAQAWTAGGFAEVDATNMPGVYRLDIPDAALAAGADDVTVVVRGASGTNGAVMTVKLSSGGLTEAQTASAVWGASVAGYSGGSTFGGVVTETSSVVNGIEGEVQDVPSNVWEELRTNHTTVGTFGQYVNAELVTPVTSAALVRMGPFEVRADGLGASDPLDIQKGAQHGIDIQCVDNNGAGIDITSATVTAKVYNSGATLVDTYSCTATYAADGRATFTIDTTVTNVPGTYTATITRTTGASDTQIFGPLRIYVRDI
jgi:hypothetical protein